ncbi:pilus assembly protein TadG-related protein [Methylobacterium sp. E-005]|uniref:TadE/TadG family type IV pilus assembly protein n=1 Tax=Methylobacterium sp. E-005 TaxID=2836549 RepID=UPI001FB92B44|nr:pilus assembly protein TadG-related protein [Methylobacterium sp. E-005]MCJ2085267.1 pilus assembly protein TadG-related protein [Methylobacterium sp. E-005]
MPILFAALLVPLVGLAGGAIDYGRAIQDRTRLNNALDAAVIVAANQAQSDDVRNLSSALIIANATQAAMDSFNSAPNLPAGTQASFTVVPQNRTVTVTGTYTSSTITSLLKIAGVNKFSLSGTAASSLNLSPMVDIYLLIDVSGSMAIGATQADINTLNSKIGCAFACHDGNPVAGTSYDAFQWAQKNGITLRINEINKGITDFVTWLQSQSSASKRLRIAVYSFSTTLTTVVPVTSTLSAASSNLPQAPSTSGDYDGATLFSTLMPTFAGTVGIGGDGITTPKKLVIIATDGVADPTRTWASYQPWLQPQVTPFSPSDCRKLDPSVSIGVLYAPYLQMTWDWGYMATLGQRSQIGNSGTRFDDIVPQLTTCASTANLFVNAATTPSIGTAFQTIFQNFTQVRLSK